MPDQLLRNAKRSTFHATLSSLTISDEYLAQPRRVALAFPLEVAAWLRRIRPSVAELSEALKTATPDQARVLSALSQPDPLQVLTAVSSATSDDAIRELLARISAVRTTFYEKAVDDLDSWVQSVENSSGNEISSPASSMIDDSVQSSSFAGITSSQAPEARPGDAGRALELIQTRSRQPPVSSPSANASHRTLSYNQTQRGRFQRALAIADDNLLSDERLTKARISFGITDLSAVYNGRDAWVTLSSQLDGYLATVGQVSPIGIMNLERLDYIPAGLEAGELIFSLPLLPGEQISIVHKQWSETDQEFQKLVDDEFETYSEKGVTEKSDLSQATSNQTQHSTQFGASVTGSGSYGPLSASATASTSISNSESNTRQQASNLSRSVTQRASARARQENKTSFRLATKSQTLDETTRLIHNPDPIHPVRFDVYTLMRRWLVEHRRYGLRLTYDVTIPDPAVDLTSPYLEMFAIDAELAAGFVPSVMMEDITPENYQTYGVPVDAPPATPLSVQVMKYLDITDDTHTAHFDQLQIKVPDGYTLIGLNVNSWDYDEHASDSSKPAPEITVKDLNAGSGDYGTTAEIDLIITVKYLNRIWISARAYFNPTQAAMQAWQATAYAQVVDAQHNAYLEQRSMLQAKRDQLQQYVTQDDPLTLRKIQREELMKNSLRWLFGSSFQFYPQNAQGSIDPNTGAIKSNDLQTLLLGHGRLVTFLQEAVEWENLNFFLYPYFWAPHPEWSNRQRIRHPDPLHEAFLRSGAARVVFTIRPGFEAAFLQFAATGDYLATPKPAYQSIEDEIRATESAQYPGVPLGCKGDPDRATSVSEGDLISCWYEYTPTPATDIKIGNGAPTEGAVDISTYAPIDIEKGRLVLWEAALGALVDIGEKALKSSAASHEG